MMKGNLPFSVAMGGAGPSGTSPTHVPGFLLAGSSLTGSHLMTARFGSQGFPWGSTDARL